MLKVRQICFIYLALMPATKLAIFPSFLANYAGGQLWLSAIIGFAVDIAVLLLAIWLGKRHGDKTLYEIIKDSGGEWMAKALFIVYALFFLCKSAIPVIEQKAYIEKTLYEVMPRPFISYPLFIVSLYACLKSLKIFGRVADITVGITVVALIAALFLSVPAGDYSNLLPIFQKPAYSVINGAFRSILWHSEGAYMLMFIGKFRKEKHYAKKIILSYAGAAVTVVLFVAVFYAVYGPVSPSQTFALPTVTIFSVNSTNAGRMDFVAIFLLLVSQVFAIILPLYFCTDCLKQAFDLKTPLVPAICVNAVIALFSLFFGSKLQNVLEFSTKYLSYFILAGSIGVTVLLTIFFRGRKYEVQKG